MIWRSISYNLPGAAFLMFFAFIIIFMAIHLNRYRKHKLSHFASPLTLSGLLVPRDSYYFWTKVLLCGIAWLFAVFALMQPKGNARYVGEEGPQKGGNSVRRNMHDVIFLLDVSASMSVQDTFGKTRESAAKEIADNVISHLKGENVALFGFTSATLQVVPPTSDYLFARLMLRNLEINEDETYGTDISQAIEHIRTQMLNMPASNSKTLILLTDGENTYWENFEGQAKIEGQQKLTELMQANAKEHWGFFVVGIGTKQGAEVPDVNYQGHKVISKLDENLLRKMSLDGLGTLFLTEELTPWQIAQKIKQSFQENELEGTGQKSSAKVAAEEQIFDEYFQFPLAIALVALILQIFLPDTRKRKNETTSR